MAGSVRRKFCVRCGGNGPFRSPGATRCQKCDADREERRKAASKITQAARYEASKRLRKAHSDEYERYFAEEKRKARRAAAKLAVA